ncbi:hypothetical protein JB92DRAFT_3150231 [Gautieria morchelliformis]|nr:hypothetical protein JB92DRAFT_3150231 [Gautieria morchelliformis]
MLHCTYNAYLDLRIWHERLSTISVAGDGQDRYVGVVGREEEAGRRVCTVDGNVIQQHSEEEERDYVPILEAEITSV